MFVVISTDGDSSNIEALFTKEEDAKNFTDQFNKDGKAYYDEYEVDQFVNSKMVKCFIIRSNLKGKIYSCTEEKKLINVGKGYFVERNVQYIIVGSIVNYKHAMEILMNFID